MDNQKTGCSLYLTFLVKSFKVKIISLESKLYYNKALIFKDNIAGVYCVVNKINKKKASSLINLNSSFIKYYNINHLFQSKTIINYRLLNSYYLSFSVEII